MPTPIPRLPGGGRQDVPIREHRAWLDRPRLTALDGPIATHRRWYRRFDSALAAGPEEAR